MENDTASFNHILVIIRNITHIHRQAPRVLVHTTATTTTWNNTVSGRVGADNGFGGVALEVGVQQRQTCADDAHARLERGPEDHVDGCICFCPPQGFCQRFGREATWGKGVFFLSGNALSLLIGSVTRIILMAKIIRMTPATAALWFGGNESVTC